MVTTFILPGLGNSGPEHWQSYWEREDPSCRRVVQADWDTPHIADWVRTLSGAIADRKAPVALVAHSSSCALVAHWARAATPEALARVRGALLVAPSDPDGPNYPPGSDRLLSGAARPAAVSQHRRGQHERHLHQPGAGPCLRECLGQLVRQRRRRRSHQRRERPRTMGGGPCAAGGPARCGCPRQMTERPTADLRTRRLTPGDTGDGAAAVLADGRGVRRAERAARRPLPRTAAEPAGVLGDGRVRR